MAKNEHEMDATEVKEHLDELTRRLAAAGVDARIHVIGGSAMALNFPNDPHTRMTQDIDAVVSPQAEVRQIVEEMANDLELSPTWLNSFSAPFVPPRKDHEPSTGGVEVTIATIEELIAMKLAASREQDLYDLGILARHAGITDPEELVDITFEAYGSDSVIVNESRNHYLIVARQALARKAR